MGDFGVVGACVAVYLWQRGVWVVDRVRIELCVRRVVRIPRRVHCAKAIYPPRRRR